MPVRALRTSGTSEPNAPRHRRSGCRARSVLARLSGVRIDSERPWTAVANRHDGRCALAPRSARCSHDKQRQHRPPLRWMQIVGAFYVLQFVMMAIVRAPIRTFGPAGTLAEGGRRRHPRPVRRRHLDDLRPRGGGGRRGPAHRHPPPRAGAGRHLDRAGHRGRAGPHRRQRT